MSFRKFLYLALAALSEVAATVLLKNMKGVLRFFPFLGITVAVVVGFYMGFITTGVIILHLCEKEG